MPTNANTFNSRVTSEALEAKYRQVFPAQGGAELVQDLFASGVIQPVVDFSSVAEGSVLPTDLQQAWDFSTGSAHIQNTTTTFISNTGFWLVDVISTGVITGGAIGLRAQIRINDGATTKSVWEYNAASTTTSNDSVAEGKFVVFLRAGDSLEAFSAAAGTSINVWYRQIADVNGNLVNPLGFTFS